jgi:uracil-DNA glycosylase family 4
MELSLTPGKPTLGPIPNTLGFDKRPVAPEGSSDAWLYLVGEAPGGKEAELGRPFVGPAGEALRDMMHEAEIDFSRVRLANAIPFRPIERSTRDRLRNRRPTQMELHTYGQSVLSDVAKVKPAVIVALGKSAAMLFGVSTPVEQARKHAVLFDRTPVHVTYHPSYVLRFGGKGSRLWKSAVRDLNRSWIEAQTRTH